jgi:hypothetical protein
MEYLASQRNPDQKLRTAVTLMALTPPRVMIRFLHGIVAKREDPQ